MDSKKWVSPSETYKKHIKSALKNCIICRIIDLSCHIISLENAAEFPFFCRTLSEALSLSLVNATIRVKAKSKKHFWEENTFQNVKFDAMLQVGNN